MKVNTDGVLLAAWLTIPSLRQLELNRLYVLDIGTGTGVISLILAQRLSQALSGMENSSFGITGIDIDSLSIEDASLNFASSKWSGHLCAECISLQEYLSKYDSLKSPRFSLIVSNPPYFTNSLKAPSERRSDARHNDTLPLSAILAAAETLLEDGGRLSVILPPEEGEMLIEISDKTNLRISRLCKVRTLPHKKIKRYMLDFLKNSGSPLSKIGDKSRIEEELTIQSGDGSYTRQYCSLVEDFYTKELRQSSGGAPSNKLFWNFRRLKAF